MGADYHLHPMGTMPNENSNIHTLEENLHTAMRELSEAKLEAARAKEELVALEKSYDRALQENLELTEQVKDLKIALEVGNIARIHRNISLNSHPVRQAPSEMKIEEVVSDLLNTPPQPPTHAEEEAQSDPPELSEGAKTRMHLAQTRGGLAIMKDQLIRSQNANRRYKERIKRMRPQVEALSDLANASFPIYEAMVEALAMGGGNPKLEKLCQDYHDKFNEAAEALSYE